MNKLGDQLDALEAEIDQIRSEFEERIASTLTDIMSEFTSKTGLSVASLDVNMIDVTTLGGPREYRVGSCEMEISTWRRRR